MATASEQLSALASLIRHTTFPPGEGLPGKVWSTREPAWVADVLNDPAFPKGPLGPAQGVRTALGFPIIAQNRVTAVMEFFSRDLRRVDRDLLQMLQGAGVQIGQFSERRAAEAAVRAKEEALRQAQEALRSYAGDLEVKVRERTAKLQETIGELEAFSYSVSHDMRAPLRAMQGFSDALLRDYSLSLDEQGKDYLSRIHRAAQRLDLLIRDVLTYSRIAKEDLLLRPVELDRFLNDVVQSYPEIQTFQSFIEVSKPLGTVFAHEAFLSQVISNLLGNALKFVAPGVPPRIRLWTEPVGDMLRLNVADNGLGIAPEHQHRIFQIFGRVYADKRFQGTGIGLAIVKKAVERMGGQVGVESNLGQGSRFWFTLRNAR
ncbi:MAG: ATP-binding protein [Verrucomicrobiota bacterium]